MLTSIVSRFATWARAVAERLGTAWPIRRRPGLVVLDDAFPNLISAFRVAEYNGYLESLPNSLVVTRAVLAWPGVAEGFAGLKRIYAQQFPRLAARVVEHSPDRRYNARAFYTIFLNNAHWFLETIERERRPFAFTLYPGGGFRLNDDESDGKLRRVLKSECFRHVICTQRITYDYLLEHRFTDPSRISYLFGGIVNSEQFPIAANRSETNDGIRRICFVAAKYTPRGVDKGYDTFIGMAKRIHERRDDVEFHVVGMFGPDDIDVQSLGERIIFHGPKPSSFFPQFHARMDAIVSPNRPFLAAPGRFDGFPTGCCVDAGFCGTAVFCTDELNQNEEFRDQKDLVIIPTDVESVVEIVCEYLDKPDELRHLGAAAQSAFRRVYDFEMQMALRWRVVRALLDED